MIHGERFDIAQVADYDALGKRLAELLPQARHQDLITQLKTRIGTRCGLIVLEHPYRDYDASSVFALFYAKKHVPPSRDCLLGIPGTVRPGKAASSSG